MKINLKKVSQFRKKTERGGDPLGFFNIHCVGKYQKIEGDPSVKCFFFQKMSHRVENTLREYPLAP